MARQFTFEVRVRADEQDLDSEVSGGGHSPRHDDFGGMVSPHRVDGNRQRLTVPACCVAHRFTGSYFVSGSLILMTWRPAYVPQVGQTRWGRIRAWQFGQATKVMGRSFQCARRWAPLFWDRRRF
jgi:hypothetical protein